MTTGPGRYYEIATRVRDETQARAVILAIFGGARGDGFEVQSAPALLASLPTILRTMADEIERDKPWLVSRERH